MQCEVTETPSDTFTSKRISLNAHLSTTLVSRPVCRLGCDDLTVFLKTFAWKDWQSLRRWLGSESGLEHDYWTFVIDHQSALCGIRVQAACVLDKILPPEIPIASSVACWVFSPSKYSHVWRRRRRTGLGRCHFEFRIGLQASGRTLVVSRPQIQRIDSCLLPISSLAFPSMISTSQKRHQRRSPPTSPDQTSTAISFTLRLHNLCSLPSAMPPVTRACVHVTADIVARPRCPSRVLRLRCLYARRRCARTRAGLRVSCRMGTCARTRRWDLCRFRGVVR